MRVARGRMTQKQRTAATRFLAGLAVFTAVIAMTTSGIVGLLVWAGYWVAGIPATHVGMGLYDFVFERRFEPDDVPVDDGETAFVTVFVYVLWVGAVPLLALAAFSLLMFRIALQLLDG